MLQVRSINVARNTTVPKPQQELQPNGVVYYSFQFLFYDQTTYFKSEHSVDLLYK